VAVGDALLCWAVNIPPNPGTALPTGKIPVGLLADLLSELPSSPPELLLGPRIGEDACAIRVPGGVLVAATDPITLTSDQPGRFSVIVNANDVAVMGVRPQWFLAVALVPAGTTQATIRELFASIGRSLVQIGAHLVGGHTELTAAVTQPLVVGQMLGLAETGKFVTTGGVRPGDIVVQVGPTPIEGAALLAREAADLLGGLDPAILKAAREALDRPGNAVVEQALSAAGLGATALHDPTEGGLASGLHEMAAASRVCLRIDRESILWFEPGAPSAPHSVRTRGPPSPLARCSPHSQPTSPTRLSAPSLLKGIRLLPSVSLSQGLGCAIGRAICCLGPTETRWSASCRAICPRHRNGCAGADRGSSRIAQRAIPERQPGG